MTAPRFWYAFGHSSREAAARSLEDSFARGDVSEAEQPEIASYRTRNDALRWGITLPM